MTILEYNKRIIQLTDTKNLHKLNKLQVLDYFTQLKKFVKEKDTKYKRK